HGPQPTDDRSHIIEKSILLSRQKRSKANFRPLLLIILESSLDNFSGVVCGPSSVYFTILNQRIVGGLSTPASAIIFFNSGDAILAFAFSTSLTSKVTYTKLGSNASRATVRSIMPFAALSFV